MIGQIIPLVKGATRKIRIQTLFVHLLGSAASASLLGLTLGMLGLVLRVGQWPETMGVAAGLAFLGSSLCDARLIKPLPLSVRRQTPKTLVCELGLQGSAFVWGVDLGQGWTTFVEFAGFYALVFWAFSCSKPLAASVLLAFYGLGRAVPVVAAALFDDRFDLGSLASVYMLNSSLILRINSLVCATAGAWLIAINV